MRARGALPAMLCLAALVLSGCVGLPGSSSVHQAVTVEEPPLVVKANPPRSGETQQQIVSDFLRAATATDEQFTVARQYLTGAAARGWDPLGSVVVHSRSAPRLSSTGKPNTIGLSAPVVGTVDATGRYRQAATGRTARTTIRLSSVRGQWRISTLPVSFGLWLNQTDFHARFHARSIYYISPVVNELIPDVRWFRDGPSLPSALARAQLEPVPAYLRGGVVTGVPTGTRLDAQGVAVNGGRAVVNLTSTALRANAAQRAQMAAQMITTLGQLSEVHQVVMQVADNPLELVGVGPTPTTAPQLGFAPLSPPPATALLLRGERLRKVDSQYPDQAASNPQTPRLITPPIRTGWIELAVPASGGQIAAIGGDRKDLGRWLPGGFHQLKRFGTGLTRPSFDGQGGLWVAGTSLLKRSSVWVIDTSVPVAVATPRRLSVPWLGNNQVVALRVAGDDQRAAMILRDPRSGTDRLALTAVVRDASTVNSGRALTLSDPLWVGQSLTHMEDVAWSGATSLVVLGQSSRHAALRPYVIDISGESIGLQPRSGATSVTAVPGTSVVYVMTSSGSLWARAGLTWYSPTKATQIVVPGE